LPAIEFAGEMRAEFRRPPSPLALFCVNIPHAAQAESGLCSVLIMPGTAELLAYVRERLTHDDFYLGWREFFRSIEIISDRGQLPDKVNVAEDLRDRGKLDDVGGPEAVRVDPTLSCDPVTVAGYVEAIIEQRKKRELFGWAMNTLRAAKNGKPSSEILEESRAVFDRIGAVTPEAHWLWISQEQIFAKGVPATEWDCKGFIPRSTCGVMLVGDSGSGKSFIATEISACMVTGEPVFGEFPVTPRPAALYLNLDAGASDFAKRAAMLGRAVPGFSFASPEEFDLERFRATVAANPGSWIVVDTFADMYVPDPKAEQGAHMRGFLRPMRALLEKYNCNGLFLDHTNRSNLPAAQAYYGSTQKKASIRQMIAIERVRTRDERSDRQRIKVSCAKMSEAAQFAPFLVDLEWSETRFRVHYAGPADEATDRASQASQDAEIITAVLAKAGAEGLAPRELIAETKLTRERVRRAVKVTDVEQIGAARSTRYVLRTAAVADDVALDFEGEE
jgi:AAA domain-containing protein/DnaB helicase-like protein